MTDKTPSQQLMHSFSNLRKSALKAYMESKQQRRRVTLRRRVVVGFALVVMAGALIAIGTAYASGLINVNDLLESEVAAPVVSLLRSDPATPEPAEGVISGVSSTQSLPSPIPTSTSTITPAPTETPLYTDTPTQTATRRPTSTDRPTATASLTPTETSTGNPPPSSTPTQTPKPTATGFPDCDPEGNPGFESVLLDLINSERKSNGLATYASQSALQAAARHHSTDMACNAFFSHTGSDGLSVSERVASQGYEALSVGEIIFATGDTSPNAPQLAIDFWLASAPNKAEILSEDYAEVGIGYIYEPESPFGGYFTVVVAKE